MSRLPLVLYVNATSDPNPLVAPLVRALHEKRVRYAYCSLDAGGPLLADLNDLGVRSMCLESAGSRSFPRTALRLTRLLRAVQPDLVHSNLFVPGAATALAHAAGARDVPVVFTRHHDLSHHVAGKRVHVAVDAWTARLADHVIAPSAAVARTLVEREHVPAKRVSVVHHGLEWPRIRPAARDASAWRERWGPSPLAVAVGRLDPLKDYPTLLRAVAAARTSTPDLQLVIAGPAGPDAAEQLAAMATAVGLRDAVHVVGHTADVHALIAAADVFVQASRAESFGLAVLEAMGLGVPLAVTTPGGVNEIVAPWYPAVPAGDSLALGRRIAGVLKNPTAARLVADAAAADVVERFTAERMAARHAAIYDRVLRARHASVG